MDALTKRIRPRVRIDLLGQKQGSVTSYSSLDRIEGNAVITVHRDTPFDELDISFEGITECSVERPSLRGLADARHKFLILHQPMDEMPYPVPRVLEKNRVYIFPFTFVVPGRLLPQVCAHSKKNAQVGRAHTSLPPSLRDPMLAEDDKVQLDDMAPEMCKVSYSIRVTMLKKCLVGNNNGRFTESMQTLTTAARSVRILPAVDEEPPLNISGGMRMYCTRKEKVVRRGFMRSKLGRLSASASQPGPIQLQPPNRKVDYDGVNTVAIMRLRFDPVEGERPPPLGTVHSRLEVSTFFGVDPWEDYPQSTDRQWGHMGRGVYTRTVPLSSLCVASAPWMKHSSFGRSTFLGGDSMHGPVTTGPSVFYTTSIIVPITFPGNKAPVPTFHSCLVSRVYALSLSVSCQTPSANITRPSVSLKIPIQVTYQSKAGQIDDPNPVPYDVLVQAEGGGEGYFCLRSTTQLSPEYTERACPFSMIASVRSSALPGYPHVPR